MAKPRKQQGLEPISNIRKLAPLADASDPAHDFLELVEASRGLKDIVLAPEVRSIIENVLLEFKHGELLRRHHLPVCSRILLCGPPGCGKTMLAEVMAAELGLPFYVARLDVLVSSYLGETASNLRKIFEFARRRPCVLFLDEVDALGRTRTDVSEHSELRRVVNSLLSLLNTQGARGPLIAATNLEGSLDEALWRRFDEIVQLQAPDRGAVAKLVALKFRNFQTSFKLESRISDLLGLTHADIERICYASIKRSLIAGRKKVSAADFSYSLKAERRRQKLRH